MPIDFVNAVDELKAKTQQFVMNHDAWAAAAVGPPLAWKKVKFTAAGAEEVPQTPGVYAFMIGSDNACLPPFSYLFYIGIAGYKAGSPRTLRDRYHNYLKEQVDMIRPLMHYYLKKYKNSAYFYFAEVDRDAHSLEDIETKLTDCLMPPGNEKDYSAEIRPQAKVVWK